MCLGQGQKELFEGVSLWVEGTDKDLLCTQCLIEAGAIAGAEFNEEATVIWLMGNHLFNLRQGLFEAWRSVCLTRKRFC